MNRSALEGDARKSALNELQFNPRRWLIDDSRPKRMLVRFSGIGANLKQEDPKKEDNGRRKNTNQAPIR
jgi:hypothetical protein